MALWSAITTVHAVGDHSGQSVDSLLQSPNCSWLECLKINMKFLFGTHMEVGSGTVCLCCLPVCLSTRSCPPPQSGKVRPPGERQTSCPPPQSGKARPPRERQTSCPPPQSGKARPPRERRPLVLHLRVVRRPLRERQTSCPPPQSGKARPPRERQTWVRFPLSPWIFFHVGSHQ